MNRRTFLKTLGAGAGIGSLWFGLSGAAAQDGEVAAGIGAQGFSDFFQNDPARHLLNRMTWGYRPRDREQLDELGLAAYIAWQLDYENIPDPRVDAFMAETRYLSLDYATLAPRADSQYEQVHREMLWARLFRAAYSERQLYERMVEFWTDHFNIPIGDLLAGKIVDDREVIRRHALGNFRDLLLASAQSPAMLHYLDNASSTAEYPNENYAREIMELHTLGVQGGYTEQDVKEVARAFTGWTTHRSFHEAFVFNRNDHDDGEKVVLGFTLAAGRGIEDGLQVIDILATHPSTAAFISEKLCRRFIHDAPPASIVQSTAARFIETGGDIRAVLTHLFSSGEFFEPAGQKFRRPMEYLVAMLRVFDDRMTVHDPDPLIWALEPQGHLPFHWHPPNGYPDSLYAWANTNALLQRWRLAMWLPLASEGWVEGVDFSIPELPAQTLRDVTDTMSTHFLGRPLPADERDLLIRSVAPDLSADQLLTSDEYHWLAPTMMGALFATPYFQFS